MTNNLAQCAADELNVEAGHGWNSCHHSSNPAMRTVSRLLARIDELEAQTKRGDAEPVDPVEALAEDIQAEYGFLTDTAGVMIREAIKRGMELAKEIG